MPRLPRTHFPGAVYHAMARGVDGRAIFIDDRDRQRFLCALETIAGESGARVLAYCLMPNHFHAAIKVGAVPLSTVMQRLLTSHSVFFNLKHDRMGHLFQARYKAVLCLDDAYLTALIRYIHKNPVRAGLAADPAAWRWSSHAAYENMGRSGSIESADDLPDLESSSAPFDPWPAAPGRSALIRGEAVAQRSLEDIGLEAAGTLPVAVLRSGGRRRDVAALKRRFVGAALDDGYTLTAISRWLGVSINAVKYYMPENNCTNCRSDPDTN